jgi:RNA polymerase-binding transcription factor DksA
MSDEGGPRVGTRRAALEAEHQRLVELRRAVSGDGLDDVVPAFRELAAERNPADSATGLEDRVRDLAILEQLDQELRDVDDALGRLERGEYGCCELCGGPIGAARLEALPATRCCVRHQVSARRRARGAGPVFLR